MTTVELDTMQAAETSILSLERLAFITACVDRSAGTLRHLLQMDLERVLAGECGTAISSLNQLIRDTQSPVAYLLLAEAQLRDGQHGMALVTLDVLSYLRPDFPEGLVVKGLLQWEYGSSTEGEASLHAAIETDPSLELAWRSLIGIARLRGASHEAAHLLSEMAYYHPGRGDPAGAQLQFSATP